MIVSNPPYIPKSELKNLDNLVQDNEPNNALTDGNDGYTFYKKFADLGSELLNDNGTMLLEIGINNDINLLKKIFCNYTIEPFNDLNKIPRVIKIY